MAEVTWPDGFFWGTAASSTQCEGAAPASDWIEWERAGRAPASNHGNGFATRYREDFALYASLGLTHHRLSLEWARIEPEKGRRDPRALAYYRDVLLAARELGVSAWVCLHHFTLPRWFADEGGFLVESNRALFARHVEFVAETFGDLVFGWQPVNETNYYASIAYRGGGWPPGHDDREEWALATEAIHLATAEAAARLRRTGRPVASIFGLSTAEAQDESEATARRVRRIHEVQWGIPLGLFREGVLRVPGRRPVARADLAGSFDLLGFSYYSAVGVRAARTVPHPPGAPLSPLGYGIWPDGLGRVLERLHAELPDTPLLIAELGIGSDDDAARAEYLRRALELVADAVGRGTDVRGLFHWTGVDNYEWLHGHRVSFGIIDRERNVRPSAQVLAAAARATRSTAARVTRSG